MQCAGLARRGHAHPQSKGGHIDGNGYRRVSIYTFPERYWPILEPMRHSAKSHHNLIFEHRIVMAIKLGRPLLPKETVHHRNGRKLDNRPGNLELFVKAHGAGIKGIDLICPHCGKGYDDNVEAVALA